VQGVMVLFTGKPSGLSGGFWRRSLTGCRGSETQSLARIGVTSLLGRGFGQEGAVAGFLDSGFQIRTQSTVEVVMSSLAETQ